MNTDVVLDTKNELKEKMIVTCYGDAFNIRLVHDDVVSYSMIGVTLDEMEAVLYQMRQLMPVRDNVLQFKLVKA